MFSELWLSRNERTPFHLTPPHRLVVALCECIAPVARKEGGGGGEGGGDCNVRTVKVFPTMTAFLSVMLSVIWLPSCWKSQPLTSRLRMEGVRERGGERGRGREGGEREEREREVIPTQ